MVLNVPCLGDSQTDQFAPYGVRPSAMWPAVIGRLFGSRGIPARVRGYGVSGDTTPQALARADILHRFGVPDVGFLYIGVNDDPPGGGQVVSQAQTQANIEAMIASLKHGAAGAGGGLGLAVAVADPTALPATGRPGQRYVVLSDTSTTGGAAAWDTAQTTNITGTSAGVTVWEHRYPLAGEFGWGRVAVAGTSPTHCKRIVVVSTNYQNWTTGGDTLTTPFSQYAIVRAAQQAAVTARNVQVGGKPSVVYADLYGMEKARIQAGTDPDFTQVAYSQARSWHYAQNNQHHSAYGHHLVAQAGWKAINDAGWLPDLAAA